MARKIKFYTDEHVALAVVRGLKRHGINALAANDAGLLGAPDEEHLKRAWNEGRVVITQDADFLRLHARGYRHAGILYGRQECAVGAFVRVATLIFEVLDADDMLGKVEYV